MRLRRSILLTTALVGLAVRAHALPIQLRDTNGTRYNINTDVDPLLTNSFASGALTDATFEKPVTVTSYFLGLTPFGWFFTTYTVQYHVDVPLTNAFGGFNGLVITGANGAPLPAQLGRRSSSTTPERGSSRRTACRTTRIAS
jgi:hypothetical protein